MALVRFAFDCGTDPGGAGDNPRHGSTSVVDDVMLKLNKRDNRAIWAFEIKGHVRVGLGSF